MKVIALPFVSAVVTLSAAAAGPPDVANTWSKTTRDLQARITLVEKPAINGTRSLVPYLEMRNVGRHSAAPLKVRCGGGHVMFQLVDADGKVIRDGESFPRSGPHADPGTVSLPLDSSIRVSMYCSNWGVPKDAAAMISTDSGAWVLKPEENGKVFLRATITGEKLVSGPDRTWYGKNETPIVKVEWHHKDSEPIRTEVRTLDGTTYQLVGRDAILYCVMVDDVEGLRRLLAEGHDIQKPHNEAGWTFLHTAVFQGNERTVEMLLEHKADVTARIEGGHTPLEIARDRGHEQIAKILRKYCAP